MWTTGSWPTPPIDWKIYRSESLWLISIKNWNNWLTIADKNCWATEAYDWGEITSANRWNFYQRWNNYWFSSITPTTSNEQVNATNYGPYYEGDTFIYYDWYVGWEWCSPHNDNLWWWVINTFKSMQGPAPDWFHVPDDNEMSWLKTTMVWLWLGDWTAMKQYLKMPYGWLRDWYSSTAEIQSRGEYWLYWTSTPKTGSFTAYYLTFADYGIWTGGSITRAEGQLIRCFRNEALIPDNTWRTLFAWTWNSWIFWNPELEVISLSFDGTSWITIADKNIWATYVYENWDTLTEWNCGWYFQRWNNYMFPFDGQLTTSSIQVDATNYGPYYYWDKFIIWFHNWSSAANYNLWGEVTRTKKAMRWPCAEWFHVPRSNEASSFVDLVHSLGISREWFKTYLKMPLIWFIDGTWWYYDNMWVYWTCSHTNNSLANALLLNYWSEWVMGSDYSKGNLIRPFKNESVVPDSTWTKLY